MKSRIDEKSVLVIGATGTVGREVALATAAEGGRVRALVRSESRAAALGAKVELVLGDLRDDMSLARAIDGVRAVFYVSPHEPDEEALADRVVLACEARGARLVFVGVHVDGATRLHRALRRFLFGHILPHYRPKTRLSERVRRTATSPIILMPPNFFQNDEVFRDEILAGVFPEPFDRPMSRVDVRDVGRAAARALLDRDLPGGAYPVVGPASLTSEECAAAWAAALGREVRADASVFEAAVTRVLAGKKREDFIASYAAQRKITLPTLPEEVERTTWLIGRAPTAYEAYVRDVAARWMGPGAARREVRAASRM